MVVLTICHSSGVGQVQLPADTTPGAEYQLDSVAEVGDDPGEGAADPIFVGVHINDQELLMELDTGAKFSVIPEKIWKDKWPELSLSSCDIRLSTYDGTIVPILGEAFVSVNYSGKCIDLRAIVVKSGKYALFGRDWLHAFRPHCKVCFRGSPYTYKSTNGFLSSSSLLQN